MNDKFNQMDIEEMTDDQLRTELVTPYMGAMGIKQLEDATHDELVSAVTLARKKAA